MQEALFSSASIVKAARTCIWQLGARLAQTSSLVAFRSGELVPSEPELCTRFGVSRTGYSRGRRSFFPSGEGFLKTGSGVGTVVLPTSQRNFLDPVVFGWVQKPPDSQMHIQQSSLRSVAACRNPRRPRGGGQEMPHFAQLYEIEAALVGDVRWPRRISTNGSGGRRRLPRCGDLRRDQKMVSSSLRVANLF